MWPSNTHSILKRVLGNILERRPCRVALLDALLSRTLGEDEKLRLIKFKAIYILLEAFLASVPAPVVDRNPTSPLG